MTQWADSRNRVSLFDVICPKHAFIDLKGSMRKNRHAKDNALSNIALRATH